MSDKNSSDRKLRIATVCFSPQTGGLELATLRRGQELRQNGHSVVSITPDSPGLEKIAQNYGIRTFHVTPQLPYLDVFAAFQLIKIFRKENIDVVLVGRSRDLSTVMLAAGKKISVVLYSQMQSGLNKKDWFHNWIFRRLDGCITITEHGKREFLEHTNLAEEKISVLPHPIALPEISEQLRLHAREKFALEKNSFVVGIVGGFDPAKGQKEFLQALGIASELEPALKEKISALLVGVRPTDSKAYITELDSIREKLSFADWVHFIPFINDTSDAYRSLDVFVLASHSETFGMVLQEAMSYGIPSIGTASGGVPELIRHGENGFLVPTKDARSIAERIVELFKDPSLRENFSSEARKFVVENYNPEEIFFRFEAALRRAHLRRNNILS